MTEDILHNSNACLPVLVFFHEGYQHNLQALIFTSDKVLNHCSTKYSGSATGRVVSAQE